MPGPRCGRCSAVVDAAALILFVQTLLGRLVGFAVAADDALGAVGNIGKDVGMEGIGAILQNVVSITAHNDTGTLLCNLQDDTALDIPQEVSGGQTVHNAGNTLGSKCVREQAAAGGMLSVLFHKLGSKTGFQRDLIYQFLVIEGNAQSLCNHTANSTSAGTELTADGNDFLFHKCASFRERLCFSYLHYSEVAVECQ